MGQFPAPDYRLDSRSRVRAARQATGVLGLESNVAATRSICRPKALADDSFATECACVLIDNGAVAVIRLIEGDAETAML
jgi:hypothetical protein